MLLVLQKITRVSRKNMGLGFIVAATLILDNLSTDAADTNPACVHT